MYSAPESPLRSSSFGAALIRLRSIVYGAPQAKLDESMNAIEAIVRQNFAVAGVSRPLAPRGTRLIL